jgi:competence protein ComEA
MAHIPTKRLAVYVVVGLVVLIVGGIGVISLRAGGTSAEVVKVGSGSGADSSRAAAAQGSSAVAVTTTSTATSTSIPASTTSTGVVFVQVAGAVRHPGVYQVAADARVFQVLQQAGGITADADQEALPLAARIFDGCKIEVPRKGQPHGEVLVTGGAGTAGSGMGGSGAGSTGAAGTGAVAGQAGAKVSLNSATVEQLDTLPGVGPKTAQEIVSYREQHGPFTSVDQLTDVKGIGPAKLASLRPLVTL